MLGAFSDGPLQASHRCMLEMSSVQATRMQAELYDEDEKLLCSSGPVSMADDDWVCLKTTTTSDGNLYKLLGPGRCSGRKCGTCTALHEGAPEIIPRLQSCVRDCSDGWTLCFDVKDRQIAFVSETWPTFTLTCFLLARSVPTAAPS